MCMCLCSLCVLVYVHMYISYEEVEVNMVETVFSLYMGFRDQTQVHQTCVMSTILSEPTLWSSQADCFLDRAFP